MANQTYLSVFGAKNAETAHVNDSSLNAASVSPLYAVWDRQTLTVEGIFSSVADAQVGAKSLLAGPGYDKRLAILTVPR